MSHPKVTTYFRTRHYVIPELYLQIQDYTGFPAFNLFWAATLFENNKIPE